MMTDMVNGVKPSKPPVDGGKADAGKAPAQGDAAKAPAKTNAAKASAKQK